MFALATSQFEGEKDTRTPADFSNSKADDVGDDDDDADEDDGNRPKPNGRPKSKSESMTSNPMSRPVNVDMPPINMDVSSSLTFAPHSSRYPLPTACPHRSHAWKADWRFLAR